MADKKKDDAEWFPRSVDKAVAEQNKRIKEFVTDKKKKKDKK